MQALPHLLRYDDAIVVVNGAQAIEKVESPTDFAEGRIAALHGQRTGRTMAFTTIAVLGLGKVGHLAAELLTEAGFEVTGFDSRPIPDAPFSVRQADLTDAAAVRAALGGQEAVLSCLPYVFNKAVASAAHALGTHYFDLTEDVATSRHIGALAESAKGVMAPQCGLAPGFVAIVGAYLAHEFERVRSIRLRVGALPQHPTGMLGYAFNWSPEGVVNEYLNDCEVIEEGVRKFVSAMEWLETVYIDGVRLEAFTTSGGIGTMCETYAGGSTTSTTRPCATRVTPH